MKSVYWEPSCSMRIDTHDEANGRFFNSANAHKKRQRKYLKLDPKNSVHTESVVTRHVFKGTT